MQAITALKYPAIPITIFLALGIFTGYHISPGILLLLPLILFAFTALIAAYIIGNKQLAPTPYFAIATIALAFSTGMLLQYLHYPPNTVSHYSHSLEPQTTAIINGTITERLKPNTFNEKYYLDVNAVNGQPATGRIILNAPKDSLNRQFNAGQKLIIYSDLKPVPKALNPYQFNYARYMEQQGIWHQVTLKGNYFKAGIEKNFNYYIQCLRATLVNSFNRHNFTLPTRNIINALLFGQRQDMDRQITQSYTDAGVVHILAISGLHFSILFLCLNWMLAPLKRLRKGILIHFILIIGFMWLFALITGLSASVVRAAVMVSFVMVSGLLHRRANSYHVLATSILVLLIARPAFLFDAGFQLSYCAVFAIVWLKPLYDRQQRSKYPAVNFIKDTVALSLIAQIGVLPLSLYYFNQFPLLFLIANVVVIPLSNIVLVLGIIVLALNFISPALSAWPAKLLEFTIAAMNDFISYIASFKSLVLQDIPFTLLLNIILYLTLAVAVLWLYRQTYKRTVALLCSVALFQVAYMITNATAHRHKEFVVFNNYNHTLLAHKQPAGLTLMSNDSLALNSTTVKSYRKGNFNPATALKPLPDVAWHNGIKILVIDSTALYKTNLRPDVVVITQSARVNLERLITTLKPKQIVADATNYKSYVNRWAATCKKQNIPFHATAEKGYYTIE